jgi:hypothetical protein
MMKRGQYNEHEAMKQQKEATKWGLSDGVTANKQRTIRLISHLNCHPVFPLYGSSG